MRASVFIRATPACRSPVAAGCALAALLVGTGCSRKASEAEAPAPAPASHAADEASQPCPFAAEIKPVVLRDLLSLLTVKLGPDRWFVMEDSEHSDQAVALLRDHVAHVTNRVEVALQDGVVVLEATREPAALCTVEIGAWTRDEVHASAIWYAATNQEGRVSYRVVWQPPHWVAIREGP